jgi:hypothetical protein
MIRTVPPIEAPSVPLDLGPDPKSSRLRSLVAAVERDLSEAPAEQMQPGALVALRASWDALVKELALGPEPALRRCPRCSRLVMRAATACAYCDVELVPPA